MSPEGRASIAAAQKARWAKLHKAGKKTAALSKLAKKQSFKAAKKTGSKATSKETVAKKVSATAPEAATS